MGSVYPCTIEIEVYKTFEGKRTHLRAFPFCWKTREYFLFKTHSFLGAFTKLRTATLSFVLSVRTSIRPPARMKQLGFQQKDFHKILYFDIFSENLLRKFKFYLNLTRITGNLCEDLCTFVIFRCITPRKRNVSERSSREKNTFFIQ
jgi:hypothetical protein